MTTKALAHAKHPMASVQRPPVHSNVSLILAAMLCFWNVLCILLTCNFPHVGFLRGANQDGASFPLRPG